LGVENNWRLEPVGGGGGDCCTVLTCQLRKVYILLCVEELKPAGIVVYIRVKIIEI
jgi:hypothetical protein